MKGVELAAGVFELKVPERGDEERLPASAISDALF